MKDKIANTANIVVIIMAYLIGLMVAHIVITPNSIFSITLLLIIALGGDETAAGIINPYIFGSLTTYIFYLILIRKNIKLSFFLCWLIIPLITTILIVETPIWQIVNESIKNSFLSTVYQKYYSHYRFRTSLTLILYYIFLQITVLVTYLLIEKISKRKKNNNESRKIKSK